MPQCTTGRVFVLKIHSADMKVFFWMQEPKSDKDDEYVATINRLINHTGFEQDFGAGEMTGTQALGQDDLLQMFRNISSGFAYSSK